MRNWWEKSCIFHGVGDTIGWESYGIKYPYFGESMDTNFTGSLNSMDFAGFSNAIGNWWGNLSISHMMNFITEWKSGWRNAPILWEKYEYQFPRLSPGFCYIFPCYGKLMGKPMHFSYIEVYHRWKSNGKEHPYYGKNMGTNFAGFAHLMVFAEFSHAIKNWLENPYISHIMKSTIGWDLTGKKHPDYGKSRSTNFPGSPHTMDFLAFSRTMGNWWEHPCTSHMMKYTTGWESDGKKEPTLWEKCDYQFPRFTNFPGFPHTMGFVVFSRTMEIDGKTREFPISWDSLIFSCVTWVCMTILITHICIWTEKTSKVRSKATLQEMLWI